MPVFRPNILALLAPLALIGCPETGSKDDTSDTGEMTTTEPTGTDTSDTGETELPDVSDAASVTYRDDLAAHPGCSTAGLSYTPASIPGFDCAAKEYVGTEDTAKPVVILIHGNSDVPASWELFNDGGACLDKGSQDEQQLAEILSGDGYRVIALDMRRDLVDDPQGNNETENLAQNMDHGWGVPLAQHLIQAVLDAYPTRQISIVGFSFGTTVARDAVRRLYINDGVDIFPRIDDMVLLAGANHGVSTSALCATNPTMRGRVTCEMGDRSAYSPTDFMIPLNGPDGAFETPCSTGESAFGRTDACSGHSVEYTTVVMQDKEDGTQQDLFVSEASSRLEGADNQTVSLTDIDQSNYFFCGAFESHYGAARSQAARNIVVSRLGN